MPPDGRPAARVPTRASCVAVTALVVGFVACTRSRPPTAEDLSAELVTAVGSHRYIEARVPGGFKFGPSVERYRSSMRHVESAAILSVLARAEELPSRHTPDGLLLRGIARLLAGRVDQSISLLTLSASADPSADAWAALSAAYIEAAAAKPESATEFLVRGLDAAERAIALDARSIEAWFNRALVATKLPPCEPAPSAWDAYSARETDPAWREEAVRLKREIVRECTQAQVAEKIPGHLRVRIEEDLLPAWGSAWMEGRHEEADRFLVDAERLALHVSTATGDPFVRHLVEGIRDSADPVRDRLASTWMSYGRARDLFDRARDGESAAVIRAAERSGPREDGPLTVLTGVHLATMTVQERQVDRASEIIERVMQRARARGYEGIVARAQIVRALIFIQRGRLSDAALTYREAGSTLERLGEPDLAAAAYGGLASTMRRLNDPRGTWVALAHVLKVLDRVQQLRRRYVVLYSASLVAQAADAPNAALRFQSAAVDVAERRQVAGAIVEAYTRRAELREQLRPGSGAADLQLARERAKEVADPGRQGYYAALIDAIEGASLLNAQPAAARERFGRAIDFFAGYDATEVPRLHLGRGRASRRAGDLDGARKDFQAGIREFEAGRLKVRAENRVAYFDAARELFDEMVALSAGDPETAFAFAERGRALTVVEALGAPVETSADRISARLPDGTALVQYATLPDRVMIWALTREGTRAAAVPEPRAMLEQRVSSLLAAVTDEQGTTDLMTQAETLYELLLRPVEHHLESAAQLVIVGDGAIHRVPFALLRTGGRYLIERFGIVNALSASAFLASEEHGLQAPSGLSALVVGNPAYDREVFDNLRPLPSSEREAAAVAAMYPRRTLLTRRDATPARFVGAAAASTVIHFGGHAVIDLEWPNRSALLLATGEPGGSALTAPEIARLRLTHAPVVVLAACSTATGVSFRMEGATSLSRAFLIAGASSVIGSLWDIEDEASEAFFTRFHRRLVARDTPAAALRAAQLDLVRAGNPRLNAPRAWAAFQLIGALSRPVT
jgi:CHAT domain-containing protein